MAKSGNKIIRNETGKLHPTEQIPSLLVKNKKLKDPKIGKNGFNNVFFLNC